MKKILIEGGVPLFGEVHISGAKNSVLPLIAATLLTDGTSIIDDCPWLSDVDTMCRVLAHLGARPNFEQNILSIDTSTLNQIDPPAELMRQMRASFLIMGPMLARLGKVRLALPGGCAIGARPIDLHLKGFGALGATINMGHGYVEAQAERLYGNRIYLDFPSVGATENLIMAASLAEGVTIIDNAAHEPEIIDLSNMLNAMGAKIKGAGTNSIRIEGVSSLRAARHTVIPDRIEAASFLAMAAATGGELILHNVISEHLQPLSAKLIECGVSMEIGYDSIHILGNRDIDPVDIKTLPYPGFPTDAQAQFMALLSVARGSSIITETVFENRFMHAAELAKMGADIRIEGNAATVNGVSRLTAASVRATDLRGGAAMIIAGQMAQGTTEITEIHHIERGYENLIEKLEKIGTRIRLVEE
ncbi:MAG: UDP-N-acetylglucosamine 1-carboxyvinyltransferase [Bacillota bacterium]|nr:UDP-N-acetylglucosamine 1-carboxyvinyltransferase [Bacillota bacterium]